MKRMYHLNPNDYDYGYFVIATEPNEAIMIISESKHNGAERFKDLTEDSLPDKYTIDVYDYGEVAIQENS